MNLLIPSLFFGFTIAVSAWMILSVIFAKRTNRGLNNRFELDRRETLRETDFVYRHFEPAIDEIAAYIEAGDRFDYKVFGEFLSASGEAAPWKPQEFLGAKFIESLFACVAGYVFARIMYYSTPTCIVVGIVCAGVYLFIATNTIKNKAKERRTTVKRSFSAAIDLLALMMEVGGSFQESLRVVARENQGKPLGEELSLIVKDIEMGKPRKHSLESFGARMSDDDISEVVFACNESEDLGVPIAETLKTQADRMRTKRTAWAEKSAQEAEVTLVLPTMLIMIACLITVAGPFVLQGVSQFMNQ